LHVVGGSVANDIVFITRFNGNITVLATFNGSNPLVFAESGITAIQVRTRGGHDIVVTTSNVTKPMTIDGGSGNDLLTGGSGLNVIVGEAGHDVIFGGAASDTILAGSGNDDLFGLGGNDVLVGGDGNDMLDGGLGRDLVIGSQDEDSLAGGDGEDILIGGFTSHDSNTASLDAIMAIWGSAVSFNDRVATLTGSGGLLEAGIMVFDDDDDDNIVGGVGRDLIFGDTNPTDGAVDTISLQPLLDVLVAVNA
jgi:Ca2+-binding RTX toxin-like protein